MANESTDVLMTFILSSGGVKAECTALWDDADTMHEGFTTGCYFEIEDFNLGVGLDTEDSGSDKTTGSSTGANRNALRSRQPQKGGDQGNGRMSARGGNKFAKYVLEGFNKYPLDIQEISVSRQMDKASPILLDNCLKLTPFKKAVIVKRKVVGGSGDSNMHHRGFLRLEFEKPLITSVEWEDGEVVKEKLKFVCRGLTVSYRPQNNDGTLGDEVPMSWTPKQGLVSGTIT